MELKVCFLGAVRRRTLICCRNVQISASSITRDRIRSTTIQPMSLQRSLIAHDHRPILDRLPSRIRFATGTETVGGIQIIRSNTSGGFSVRVTLYGKADKKIADRAII